MIDKVNLLPDSKTERLKARRTRQIAITVAMIVLAVAIGVPLLLLGIKGSQALLLNRVQSQIDERKAQIQETPEITTMLTAKDHLNALPGLYSQRNFLTELTSTLTKFTPKSVSLSNLTIDSAGTLTMTGFTSSYADVNKFYQSLLNAGLKADPRKVDIDPQSTGFFTNVVLQNASGTSGDEVVFTIDSNFSFELIDGVAGQ